jgi:hypothetical protein
MKLCGASRACACGRYLIVPPDLARTSWNCAFSRGSQYWTDQCVGVPDPTAPLSKWDDVASYDKLTECEVDANHKSFGTTSRDISHYDRCIASDDPRPGSNFPFDKPPGVGGTVNRN